MRDHGGDLDRARTRHGDGDWLDLSTGINAMPYPVPDLHPGAWSRLPTMEERRALEASAQRSYRTRADVVALAGAQAAIQIMPALRAPGAARILSPTYNEHAAALRGRGWAVQECSEVTEFAGADLAVVVNPNNPDGRRHDPEALLALARDVGLFVVDESFADPEPALSLAPLIGPETHGVVVLRSFGKFYGLAGLRLGFALSGDALARRFRAASGPWPVSGPAIAIGRQALADTGWQRATTARLEAGAAKLDDLAARAGWRLVGGTTLFRTYATDNAAAAQDRLASHRIWTRIFPWSAGWIRLGLPGTRAEWDRLESALARDG